MSEEKIKVLDMLKEGVLTTEEAMKLLEQLDNNEKRQRKPDRSETENQEPQNSTYSYNKWYENPGKRRDYNQNSNWINDMVENITEGIGDAVQNIQEAVQNMHENFGQSIPNIILTREPSRRMSLSVSSAPVAQDIMSLRVAGKNDGVRISAYDGDSIRIDGQYKTKGNANPAIEFVEENGHYALSYDTNAVHSMGLSVRVPRRKIHTLCAESKNAGVELNEIEFVKAELATSNAHIRLYDVRGTDLMAETSNASIHLEGGTFSVVRLHTSNAKITMQNVNADSANLKTSNAPIHIENVDIRQIQAKTSNAGLKFKGIHGIDSSQYPEYSIEAYTSNSEISAELPYGLNIPFKIKASTSRGGVYGDFKDMEYVMQEKSYINAKSKNYDNAAQRINFVFQTSNGNIHLKS